MRPANGGIRGVQRWKVQDPLSDFICQNTHLNQTCTSIISASRFDGKLLELKLCQLICNLIAKSFSGRFVLSQFCIPFVFALCCYCASEFLFVCPWFNITVAHVSCTESWELLIMIMITLDWGSLISRESAAVSCPLWGSVSLERPTHRSSNFYPLVMFFNMRVKLGSLVTVLVTETVEILLLVAVSLSLVPSSPLLFPSSFLLLLSSFYSLSSWSRSWRALLAFRHTALIKERTACTEAKPKPNILHVMCESVRQRRKRHRTSPTKHRTDVICLVKFAVQ